MEETVFNRVMRRAREKRWTQSELAKRLDLLPQHVSNWKTRGVPPERYEAIADALDCSIDELLGRMKYVAGAGAMPAPWPFHTIDEAKVRALDDTKRNQLEAAIIIGAAQLGLDVKKDA